MMSVLNILPILILLLELAGTDADDAQQAPLEIIWHVPTHGFCEKYDIHIDVTQYGMLENSSPRSNGLQGDVITILYKNLGKWPYINDDGIEKNEGFPQYGDIDAHLAQVEEDINNDKKIPKDFSGLGVLDFEEWFALYNLNFKNGKQQIYRDETENLEGLVADPVGQYNEAAKNFFKGTLLKAKQMRPGGKWGYYIYPKCNYKVDLGKCPDHMYEYVTKLEWLAMESDALYPSVYYNKGNTSDEKRPGMVIGSVNISRYWLDAVKQPHKPIYLYTRTSLEKTPPYYSDADLIYSLGTATDMGINGIIIWGSTKRVENKTLCQSEEEHVKHIGPYIQKLLNFADNCSRDLCNSHGRCAKNYVEKDINKIGKNLDADHVYVREDVAQEYHCRCYEGWTGTDCAQPE